MGLFSRLWINTVTSIRQAIQRRAGLTHDGERDMYQILGYPTELNFEHYLAMYTRGDVAGRVVDMPAQETWRNNPVIVKEDDKTEMEEFTKFAKRVNLFHWMERADRLAGIGRFSVLFIGAPGALTRTIDIETLDDIKYLNAFHEGHVRITSWDESPGSPRFGQPLMYEITFVQDDDGYGGQTQHRSTRRVTIDGQDTEGEGKGRTIKKEVHWSRVIHVVDDPLTGVVFGRPRLERVYNRMLDLTKISGGSAEMFWQNVAQIYHLNLDPEYEYNDADLEALDEKFKEMLMGLRRVIQTEGIEKINTLSGATPDPTGIFAVLKSMISSAAEIPQRILFGSEQGELASTQDQGEWYGRIAARRSRTAEPFIIRPFVQRLIDNGIDSFDNFSVKWPELFEIGPEAKATIARGVSMMASKLDADFPERVISIPEARQLVGLSAEYPELPEEVQKAWEKSMENKLVDLPDPNAPPGEEDGPPDPDAEEAADDAEGGPQEEEVASEDGDD